MRMSEAAIQQVHPTAYNCLCDSLQADQLSVDQNVLQDQFFECAALPANAADERDKVCARDRLWPVPCLQY